MSEKHVNAWVDNVRGKVSEVEKACHSFILNEPPDGVNAAIFRDELFVKVNSRIDDLSSMFSPDRLPTSITLFRTKVRQLRHNRTAPTNLMQVIESLSQLHDLHQTETHLISFHDIYEAYKNDEELDQLVDQLIKALEKIIEEGEDTLNSRLEKDLKRLLDQLKGAKATSLYELGAWAEVISRIMLEIYSQKTGIPGASLFVDAAKLAWKVKQNLGVKYQKGESELVRLLEIKTVGTDINKLPFVTSELLEQVDNKPPN